jgi:arylsulfatase A-like enzyme
MVSALDLFPTALAAATARLPADAAPRDGVELRQGLSTDRSQPFHKQLYWRSGPQAALRQGQWKLVRVKPDAAWQLFDLSLDVSEARDAAAQHPDIRDRLGAAWDRMNGEMAQGDR